MVVLLLTLLQIHQTLQVNEIIKTCNEDTPISVYTMLSNALILGIGPGNGSKTVPVGEGDGSHGSSIKISYRLLTFLSVASYIAIFLKYWFLLIHVYPETDEAFMPHSDCIFLLIPIYSHFVEMCNVFYPLWIPTLRVACSISLPLIISIIFQITNLKNRTLTLQIVIRMFWVQNSRARDSGWKSKKYPKWEKNLFQLSYES